jgi:hypothetical protein
MTSRTFSDMLLPGWRSVSAVSCTRAVNSEALFPSTLFAAWREAIFGELSAA